MALRTSSGLVIAVLQDDYDITEAPDLGIYMRSANRIVTAACIDTGYDVDTLTDLETLLSCHFYHHKDRRTQMEGVAGITSTFQTKTDFYLKETEYGIMAIQADPLGSLAMYQKRLELGGGGLSFTWLGTDECTGT